MKEIIDPEKVANPCEADFAVAIVDNSGMYSLRPLSDAAREWLAENIPDNEDRTMWCDGVVIERSRYLDPILHGIFDAGLSCAVNSRQIKPALST